MGLSTFNAAGNMQRATASRAGDVLFSHAEGVRLYREPVEIVTGHCVEEVRSALTRVEGLVDQGLHAAGYLAYECASAFDSALVTHSPSHEPLYWFGLYRDYVDESVLDHPDDEGNASVSWMPFLWREEYEVALDRVRALIASGDTYQVNLTFPLSGRLKRDPLAWFRALLAVQRSDTCAYVDTGKVQIVSLSPETFFQLDGTRIVTRPMKGTAPRGMTPGDDGERARMLRASSKEQAENLMIVDMLRNDLGRIARQGSVRVPRLFDLERYDTVWQMTSTVTADTDASIPEIFGALFPSASVTGAPKVRTMEIIRELEKGPRGVYCGAIGWWAPSRRAAFNVAIRTLVCARDRGVCRYDVGAGITWDSTAVREYEECLLKARVLDEDSRPFELLESLLWDGGYFLLERHLERLQGSAEYFGFRYCETSVRSALEEAVRGIDSGSRKVRLLLSKAGSICTSVEEVKSGEGLRAAFARELVSSADRFLYHKTTRREVYERARADRRDVDDVILMNERGEVTESTVANVVIELGGRRVTPPTACGLLAGTLRAELIETGEIAEQTFTRDDVEQAEAVYLINSVRKWMPVRLIDDCKKG